MLPTVVAARRSPTTVDLGVNANLSQVQVPQDEYHNVSDDGDNSDDMTDYDNSSEECEELETEVITDDFLFDV